MTAQIINRLTPHRYYPANRIGRDYFVGDLHGKYALLRQALQKINFDFDNDRLFSVGDLIDRGEEPFQCLLLAQENWFIPVLGNHEQFLIECEDNDINKKIGWYLNGGEWWEYLHPQERHLAKKIIEEKFSLTLTVETLAGKVGVIHAQYPLANWPLKESSLNRNTLYELLWSRDCLSSDKVRSVAGIDFIVSGHTPLTKPLLKGRQLFIDTGCGHRPSAMGPSPHLTICEFKKEHVDVYALTEQQVEFSKIQL
ncbi:MAG: putative phosphodiesterase [Psychromonas sp.]|jgi:predicted phosphodiesterase|uniref:metallophosphoesterase n=1 Tax=Psychromonas sp. TaxID=1884585 RepID=UPI0039E2A522